MPSTRTSAITKATKSEDGYIVYSRFYNLPNKTVLYLTWDQAQKHTTLKIFSTDDLITSLAERILKGPHDLLCILSDGSLLLQKHAYGDDRTESLHKICHNTLNTLSTQPWNQAYSAGVIDDKSFFIIKDITDRASEKPKYSIVIYQWKEIAYVESSNTPLSVYPESFAPTNAGYIGDILQISKNRYSCSIRGHNTDDFRILIFDIDAETNEVHEHGVIQPKSQHPGASSLASGSVVALPNSQLLTYQETYDNVQIWDTNTRTCVKEWDWDDIQTPEGFSFWLLKIKPFPDSLHLLVHQGEKIYFFNTDKLMMKPIELANAVESTGKHHILPNGQLLAFIKQESNDDDHVNIMHFDLPEIAKLRNIMTESQYLVRMFFRRNNIPEHIAKDIYFRAVTPEATEMLAIKIADMPDDENNDRSLVM